MKIYIRNKSALTGTGCVLLTIVGWFYINTPVGNLIMTGGIFGFSGAITNWLAIHMLFEKIPFLYGSGIIQLRFESFKKHIRELIMDTFFTIENLQKHLPEILSKIQVAPDINKIAEKIDGNVLFDEFTESIEESSLGGLLTMFGGKSVLEGFREAFCQKVSQKAPGIIRTVLNDMADQGKDPINPQTAKDMIEHIITEKLEELTPKTVKNIVEKMIREHLGWLVIWGGVFGFVIGAVSVLLGIF